MKFKIEQTVLLEALKIIQNAIASKGTMPILENILLQVSNKKLLMVATNMDLRIQTELDVEPEEEGATTVSAKKFIEIVNSFPVKSLISIAIKKETSLILQSGKIKCKIITLSPEDFPKFTIESAKYCEMDGAEMKELLNLTDFAVSKDDTRYVLTGLFMSIKGNNIEVAGTDGRRLAIAKTKLSQKTEVDRNIIVPLKALSEIKRNLAKSQKVSLALTENKLVCILDNCLIVSRLIEGDYPDYFKVVPAVSEKTITINKETFVSALKRAKIFVDDNSEAVKMEVTKDKLTLSKNSCSVGESEEKIDIKYTGKDNLEIGFNPEYLIDALGNISESEVVIELGDAKSPLVVRKDNEYTHVILPMQLVS